MNPINSFEKWLLNILMPYIEGKRKQKGMDKEWMILGNRLEGRNICMTKINCLEDWGVNFRK